MVKRILKASDELAVRAFTVEALDDRAASFYRHFGFEPTELAPRTPVVPRHTVRNALRPHGQSCSRR